MSSSVKDAYRTYYEEGYRESHPLAYDMDGADEDRWRTLRSTTQQWLSRLGLLPRSELRIVELGSAMGQLQNVHPGYIGLDFSGTALARAKRTRPETPLVHGDMQALPFKTDSIDAVFSWAAIEHVPRPGSVFEEIARVLKPGGAAILGPAWNCRSWTVKRLDARPYRELRWPERLEKLTIPIRSMLVWRATCAAPGRLRREAYGLLGIPTDFDYQQLRPDFSLELPHVSDDDAQASMDPHAAIMFYRTRGWTIRSHPNLRSRLLARHEAVVVQKPADSS